MWESHEIGAKEERNSGESPNQISGEIWSEPVLFALSPLEHDSSLLWILCKDVTGDLHRGRFTWSADVETVWYVLCRGLRKQLSVALFIDLETKMSKPCGMRVSFGNYSAPVLRKSQRRGLIEQ